MLERDDGRGYQEASPRRIDRKVHLVTHWRESEFLGRGYQEASPRRIDRKVHHPIATSPRARFNPLARSWVIAEEDCFCAR
jgi:hypothetical protein